jgi:hypothetical protein
MTPYWHVGNYCGRTGPGFWDEPLGVWSNVAFLIGAAIALRAYLRAGGGDGAVRALIVLGAAIGAGSFVFHAHPTPRTLPIDLIPIQVFGIAYVWFGTRRYLGARPTTTVAAVLGFVAATMLWNRALGPGVLGGAASHAPSVAALVGCGAWLAARADARDRRVGRRLLAAATTYTIALVVRALDQPLCADVPYGLHWVWHAIQGVTVGILLHTAATCDP